MGPIAIKANSGKSKSMQIARDSGRIINVYTVQTGCPWCQLSEIRYDLEFQVARVEKGQVIDSGCVIKKVCTHCLTVCDEPPRMDFLCAMCGQLTLNTKEDSGSEQNLFKNLFAGDGFEDFYERLISGGVQRGKRFCLPCISKIWLAGPDSLSQELEKPKPKFASKNP